MATQYVVKTKELAENLRKARLSASRLEHFGTGRDRSAAQDIAMNFIKIEAVEQGLSTTRCSNSG